MKKKNKKKKSILIVGGTGFIGYNIAKKLINNYNISSISKHSPKKIRKIKNIKYLYCDISNKKKLKKVIKNINFDYVINLGGYVNHTEEKKTYESHYKGCRNLAEIFREKKIKRFIQVGSSVEYGNHKSPQYEHYQCKEKELKSVYGMAKLKANKLLIDYFKSFNFPVVILRLYLVFGPYQDINRFIPIIISSCLKNKYFSTSSGKQYRDFLYIDDLVRLISKFLNNKKIFNGQIFNVGSGRPRKIKNVVNLIIKKLKGGRPNFGKIKFRKDEITKLFPSIKKIKKYTDWNPKTSFSHGLQKTINHYKKNLY